MSVMVDPHLIKNVHATELLGDGHIDVGDGLLDAFSEVAALIAVPQFHRFVHAGARPRRNSCTPDYAFACDDFNFYGWIAPGIQDFTGMNVINVLHVQAGCVAPC